ncbi:hypothetical protein [Methylorubrum sp. SB2]|uniref:hypothetical protein n=1 Tax=Methylorubrum subtropicum TaxID=3138812 RepID=UPI00313E6DDF
MQAFFSSDGSFVVQFLVIFLVILVLLIGAVLLFRRFSGRGLSLTAGANGRGRQPRLGIVDIYELDRQRQLILLRRDNVEHLLLVGGPNDVVIERNIQRGAGARYAPEPDQTADPALDAARADKFLDSPAPPAFAMPEVVPPALPGAEPPHPERTPPLDPGLFEPEVVSPTPAAPARSRPASPVSRLIRRSAPPLADTPPEPVPPPAPAPAPPPASEPVPETPPVIAGRGPRPVDPAVLSDMARQLQVALKRPSSAVTPPPGGPESPPLPPAPDLRPDPLAAAMAAAQADPPPAPKPPAPAKPTPAKSAPAKPAPAPKPAAEAKPAAEPKVEAGAKAIPAMTAPADPAPVAVPPPAPPQPAPAPKPAPAKPAEAAPKPAPEAKPAPAPPKPEPAKPDAPAAETTAQNPFSVEEIEAEFARLLGRPLDNNKG